ncbi:MAG: tRNA glutamyl-Q(34) synthetase GluQRS [bacterium]
MARVTRFAPSPTGPLHLGHAYAAMIAAQRGDRFLLRIEDIDQTRCRPEYETLIYDDLHWLGLSWEQPVLRQSDRSAAYTQALDFLATLGLTYHCTCTRADIRAALSAPQGPDGPVYPGTCRDQHHASGALRLNMAKATAHLPDLTFTESGQTHRFNPRQLVQSAGDVILARRDIGTAYHLAVVVDDAFQGITEVTRGADLLSATPLQVTLQHLLDLPTPAYHHHRLIRDDHGKRLAKRDDSRALSGYRAEGVTPDDIRRMVAP